MSKKLQPVRGTKDILPNGDMPKFNAIIDTAKNISALYGFQAMNTPIFESTDVFKRSIGESSDIVSKEMYTFESRGGESLTLRPEFTAGIARAFISNGMQQHLPLKVFSHGPLFRYERPQKGRQRQFHQINCEWLGDDSLYTDIEMITLASHILTHLLGTKSCTLHINTLGDADSRTRYKNALVAYLTPFTQELSADSQRRLTQNPLRILDSKDPNDKKILQNAPKIHDADYLSPEAQKRFKTICNALEQNEQIPHPLKIDPTIVRGLDYYTGIVFEFVTEIEGIGSQNTILAGGRYDRLIEEMGGPSTPAIGFAGGLERLCLIADYQPPLTRPIYILPHDTEESHLNATILASILRKKQQVEEHYIPVEILFNGAIKKRMKKANSANASYVYTINDDKTVQIKDMDTEENNQSTTLACIIEGI